MLSVYLLPVFCNHQSTTPATMASAKRKRKCNFTSNEKNNIRREYGHLRKQ